MEIRTPEDIEAAYKVIYNLKDEIKKIEKQIACAKNKFDDEDLKNEIHTAVRKVLNNEGGDAYAEIDILHRRYQIVLSRGDYYNWNPTHKIPAINLFISNINPFSQVC